MTDFLIDWWWVFLLATLALPGIAFILAQQIGKMPKCIWRSCLRKLAIGCGVATVLCLILTIVGSMQSSTDYARYREDIEMCIKRHEGAAVEQQIVTITEVSRPVSVSAFLQNGQYATVLNINSCDFYTTEYPEVKGTCHGKSSLHTGTEIKATVIRAKERVVGVFADLTAR